ncbi:hypothetical protein [Corynebacterium sp. MSK158]|uniref:hypothetical protein n=1 Tax=Corynebacterium sp. MSK158 TaxID=3050212 RepID=UPI00254A9D36|nr:hypothetical protein [Corynebacterium sp. MSK158]MDK8693597.1 hypothetical protein [Corynebacterium sp. MSK158]
MTNLTTTNLKCLLEKATAAPWTVEDDGYDIIIGNAEGHRMGWGDQVRFKFEAGDKKHDPQLAALAPELAQEVINLRDALGYLVEETRLAAENSDDVVVQKRVADAIKTTVAKIQGETNE